MKIFKNFVQAMCFLLVAMLMVKGFKLCLEFHSFKPMILPLFVAFVVLAFTSKRAQGILGINYNLAANTAMKAAAGVENEGGIPEYFYYCKVEDFATIGAVASSPSTLATNAEISATHTFTSTNGFAKMYGTLDMSDIEDTSVGEADSFSFKSLFKFCVPGDKSTKLGFANLVKNDRFIVLVPQHDGNYRQIGTATLPARFFAKKVHTGKLSSGGRKTEYEVEAFNSKLMVYPSSLTITEVTA